LEADPVADAALPDRAPKVRQHKGLLLKDCEHENIISNASSSSGGTTMEEDQMEEQT
jgi:hypothetical protein